MATASFNALTHAADFGEPIDPKTSPGQRADIRRRAGVSRELLALVLDVGVNTLERYEHNTTQSSRLVRGATAERYRRVLEFLDRITKNAELEESVHG